MYVPVGARAVLTTHVTPWGDAVSLYCMEGTVLYCIQLYLREEERLPLLLVAGLQAGQAGQAADRDTRWEEEGRTSAPAKRPMTVDWE